MSVAIRIKPGLVERLREVRGINSEDAFARLIGADRTTLRRVMSGSQPSGAFIAGFCDAFGLGLGEAFEVVRTDALQEAA
jgi:transcriptional regulator with XRE-family HTH domain